MHVNYSIWEWVGASNNDPDQGLHTLKSDCGLSATNRCSVKTDGRIELVFAQSQHLRILRDIVGRASGHQLCSKSASYRIIKRVKVAHTRLPSVGFRSLSRFLAVSLQVTWVINPTIGCHYFPTGLQLPPQPLRGLLPILVLGEQRHDGCEQFA